MRSTIRSIRRPSLRALRIPAAVAAGLLIAGEASSALAPPIVETVNRLTGMRLFVNLESPARRQAEAWRAKRPSDAALLDRIAAQPVAKWIGDWSRDVRGDVSRHVARARQGGMVPVFVAYNIPNRDCGSYSAGGSNSASAYRSWIASFAAGLTGKTVVVLEPDAVAGASCLSAAAREERYALLAGAIRTLKAAGAVVYLDAGHARWHSASEIASRLEKAGIAHADGFALNVSNYIATSTNAAYGRSVSKLVGGKHFIIDTSRNGAPVTSGAWCNVAGAALGSAPTTDTGDPLIDAFLWVKQPGESDGTCGGGPSAGKWWPEYALRLAQKQVMLASR